MRLFDAHAHLAAPEFSSDLPAVLDRAEAAGVFGILAVVETPAEGERILELAARHPAVKPAVGLFPTILDRAAAAAVFALARSCADALVALGEVGLDRWAVKTEAEWRIQEEIFAEFVALSRELDLPLNVHTRSAGRHTIAFLRRCGATRVLLHAFDGKAASAAEGVDAGYYFSIPPSVIRSPQKQKLVRYLPLETLLLETDSPVLGPDPARRNEPANIRVSCQAVAEIKGVTSERVAEVTTENARRLFPRAFA